jgi:hypothetical protein
VYIHTVKMGTMVFLDGVCLLDDWQGNCGHFSWPWAHFGAINSCAMYYTLVSIYLIHPHLPLTSDPNKCSKKKGLRAGEVEHAVNPCTIFFAGKFNNNKKNSQRS